MRAEAEDADRDRRPERRPAQTDDEDRNHRMPTHPREVETGEASQAGQAAMIRYAPMLTGLFVSLACASPSAALAAAHHPSGDYAPFADCPLGNPRTDICFFAQAEGGELRIGRKAIPIAATLLRSRVASTKTGPAAISGSSAPKAAKPSPGSPRRSRAGASRSRPRARCPATCGRSSTNSSPAKPPG